jgi:hypothetical protein
MFQSNKSAISVTVHEVNIWRILHLEGEHEQTYRVRSGDVMCFLWDPDKPTEFIWVLNKRQNDG